MANFVSTGAFYPMIVLCGLLWPIEGMPQYLRDFALLLPFTVPTISVSAMRWHRGRLCQFSIDRRFPSVSGAEHLDERNVHNESERLQWIHRDHVVDCRIIHHVLGRTAAKEVKQENGQNELEWNGNVLVSKCRTHIFLPPN